MVPGVPEYFRLLVGGLTGYVVATYVLGTFFVALALVGCQSEVG